MIDSFDKVFIKLLIKSENTNFKKQTLGGLLMSIIFIVFFNINPNIVKVAVLSYLLLSSFASFLDKNEIFMVYDDFRILDFDIYSIRFYKSYIIQRLIKDTYVMNLILVFIGTIFLIYKDFYSAIWFLLIILAYILLSPLNHIVGIKYNNMVLIKVIFDVIVAGILIVGTVNNNALIKTLICDINKPKGLLYVFLCILCLSCCLLKLSRIESNKVKNYNLANYSKILNWMKKIDIHVYKDYILNFPDIVMNVINSIVFFYIMRDGFSLDSTYLTILFIIIPTGLFVTKKEKKYKILSIDNFFYNLEMEFDDIKYIRKKKLKTIFSEVIIKTIVCSIILLIDMNFESFIMLLDVVAISIVIAMIHFMIIIRNNKISAVYMTLIKYTLIILPMIKNYIEIDNIIYWGYISLVGILTLYMTFSHINEEDKEDEKIIRNNL